MQEHNELMAQLGARFLARLGQERDEIAEALASGDHDRVRHIAHQIAGIAGSFGHVALGDAAYNLEQAIEHDPAAVEGCWQALDGLSSDAIQGADAKP